MNEEKTTNGGEPEQRGAGGAVGPHVSIGGSFNGPTESGNGGYSCGLFAQFGEGPSEVELRSPVPLDVELEVEADGETLSIKDGETLVGSVKPGRPLEIEVPAPPTPEEAGLASRSYRAPSGGIFSNCFVCGIDRPDAFGVFAGPVAGRPMVASRWTPDRSTGDRSGLVREEMIWAVLDCPTYFALYPDESYGLPPAFLARMQAEVVSEVEVGREYVVAAWPIERDGRKLHAGSAVFNADGALLAFARVLLIEARTA